MIIGAISIVRLTSNYFLAVQCPKRGVIFPGGKVEEGETFHVAAARELLEETGAIAISQQYVFGGMIIDSGRPCYTYTFVTRIADREGNWVGDSGEVIEANWSDLLNSRYESYYLILKGLLG